MFIKCDLQCSLTSHMSLANLCHVKRFRSRNKYVVLVPTFNVPCSLLLLLKKNNNNTFALYYCVYFEQFIFAVSVCDILYNHIVLIKSIRGRLLFFLLFTNDVHADRVHAIGLGDVGAIFCDLTWDPSQIAPYSLYKYTT